jgi:hypothetical protein
LMDSRLLEREVVYCGWQKFSFTYFLKRRVKDHIYMVNGPALISSSPRFYNLGFRLL